MNRCDICLDAQCTRQHCNCAECDKSDKCPKFLHPTIRITTKCTQQCQHCAFSCGPDCGKMMSIKKAEEIALFLMNNDILSVNCMGGEFFCNPDWLEILDKILNVVGFMRLVTNSDWAGNNSVKENLIVLNKKYPERLHMSLSFDSWHTNEKVKSAEGFLSENGFAFNVEKEEQSSGKAIVPIGRSDGDCGFYGLFACYCHNPMNKYSFLIDEDGIIYKCPFGVLDYADIKDYINGGFAQKFKEFNLKFYDIWLSSCASCIRATNGHHSA